MSRCDVIADALVMGEPLSAEDQGHVEGCAACRQLTALPAMLAASKRTAPARPGFSARMMAAARERIAQRRRRRVVTFTLALAAVGASAVTVDRMLIRDRVRPQAAPVVPAGISQFPTAEPDPLDVLESFGKLDHAVDWDDIEAPVQKYRTVVLRHGGHK